MKTEYREVAWRVRYIGAGKGRITESRAEVTTAREMGAEITPLYEKVEVRDEPRMA